MEDIMEPLKETCSACSGEGVVSRERRRLESGEFDPADLRPREVCPRCGGGGKVEVNKAAISEKAPGYIADNI